jgi:16S rRNA (guanine527-N7)-methyltransferase
MDSNASKLKLFMKVLTNGACKLGIELDDNHQRLFELYYQELLDWNKKINLTTIVDYEAVQLRHFLDSLTIILVLTKEELTCPNLSLIDIGTGAGFPGIPLKIVLPHIRLALLDATAKKTTFLCHLVKKMELLDVNVITGRAEEVAHSPLYRQQFNLVVSRAVASMATLVELTLPFCKVGEKLVAYKKGKINEEIREAAGALDIMGGKITEIKKVGIEELGNERYLVVVKKIYQTSDKYPRRSGIPARKPIGKK